MPSNTKTAPRPGVLIRCPFEHGVVRGYYVCTHVLYHHHEVRHVRRPAKTPAGWNIGLILCRDDVEEIPGQGTDTKHHGEELITMCGVCCYHMGITEMGGRVRVKRAAVAGRMEGGAA